LGDAASTCGGELQRQGIHCGGWAEEMVVRDVPEVDGARKAVKGPLARQTVVAEQKTRRTPLGRPFECGAGRRVLGARAQHTSGRVAEQLHEQRQHPMEEQPGLDARDARLGLTEAERRLNSRARAVRDAAEGARLALRQRRDQLDGTLRISATTGFDCIVLAPPLARFQVLHPAICYELFFTARRVDLLREGLDVAFRVTSKPPEAWVAQPALNFAVHADRLGGTQALSSPQELGSTPMLLGQNEEPLASQWRHEDGRREDVTLQASAWGSDLEGLIALARHGSGVVLSPDFCVDAVPGCRSSATAVLHP
jgi:hypothetical protein